MRRGGGLRGLAKVGLVCAWLVLGALALSGLGVYASFTDGVKATQQITTGCLKIAFTQVDGKVPADPRSVTWTAVVKKNEIHIVHKATVTNVCTLRVGGGTLLVQQVTTGNNDSAAKSTSEGGDGEGGGLTLAVVATGPSGASSSRTDPASSWQAIPWVITPAVSGLNPQESMLLTLTLDGTLSGGGDDIAGKDDHGGGDDRPPTKTVKITYTLAARE